MAHYRLEEDRIPILTGLYFQIMTTLAAGPMHGYAVAKVCKRESNGAIAPAPGALYAAIERLSKMHYIVRIERTMGAGSANARQVYALTEVGRMILASEADRLSVAATLARKRLKT